MNGIYWQTPGDTVAAAQGNEFARVTSDGICTFDWPAIEAAAIAPNDGFGNYGRNVARLLLAARDAGGKP